eukprot:TRINITY_DN864_c0_g1_i2.p1 TRINITY_DN864_c0_g1~~TRINITY_DN864_c0_g1_i2.p1  ORF type:complete len:119 (+),score=1.99 TRINITY_DN864_c0_g1_i2:132-488(+)
MQQATASADLHCWGTGGGGIFLVLQICLVKSAAKRPMPPPSTLLFLTTGKRKCCKMKMSRAAETLPSFLRGILKWDLPSNTAYFFFFLSFLHRFPVIGQVPPSLSDNKKVALKCVNFL